MSQSDSKPSDKDDVDLLMKKKVGKADPSVLANYRRLRRLCLKGTCCKSMLNGLEEKLQVESVRLSTFGFQE